MMNKYHKIKGLYAIIQSIDDDNYLIEQAQKALRGGASMLQYRSKSPDNALKYRQGKQLQTLCREFAVLFIINDDLDLTIKLNADGLHLGQNDMTIRQARIALGPRSIIGASCYNSLDIAHQSQRDGANYLAFETVYPSTSQTDTLHAPLSLFGEARTLGLPLIAVGGINANNAKPLIDAGADALAVIEGIFDSPDPQQAANAISQLFLSRQVRSDQFDNTLTRTSMHLAKC